MFQDRADAGQRLAELLEREGVDADIVLGIPRGAMPVADALNAPLDIVVAQKMGAPDNPELAIGAAAAGPATGIAPRGIPRTISASTPSRSSRSASC
jgi:predicted phosphoribosyltransferase